MSTKRRRQNRADGFSGLQDAPTASEADKSIFGTGDYNGGQYLRPVQDGVYRYGPFELTRVGFSPPSNAADDHWMQLGSFLFELEGSLQWLIGDFLVHQKIWGDTEDIAAHFEREVTTLYNYSTVARKVEFSRRREKLSFGHHQVVSAMEPDDQTYWLEYAEENRLTVAGLRKAIRASKLTESAENVDDVSTFVRQFQTFYNDSQRAISMASRDELQEMRSLIASQLKQIDQRLKQLDNGEK